MLRKLMIALGAPRGESPDFYRDVALAFLAIPAGLLAGILAAAARFNGAFWVCSAAFVLCVIFAKTRSAIIAAPLAFAGIRAIFSFFLKGHVELLVVGLACLLPVAVLWWWHDRHGS